MVAVTYLTKIDAIRNNICAECGLKEDDAEHTLFECISFEAQREKMRSVIGNNLTYDTTISAIAETGEKSPAIQTYSETMKVKEERDRENERNDRIRQHRTQKKKEKGK